MSRPKSARRSLRVAASTAALALLLTAAASIAHAAGGIRSSSTITFVNHDIDGDRTDQFIGQVLSPKHKCTIGRKVVLFHQLSGADTRIAAGKSKRDGFWTIGMEDPRFGFYYVKVKKKRIQIRGRTRLCRAGRSGNLPVEPN